MPVSDEAQKNHDELFPGYISALKQTDPEFIEYFDNFAFDEVLRAFGDRRGYLRVSAVNGA